MGVFKQLSICHQHEVSHPSLLHPCILRCFLPVLRQPGSTISSSCPSPACVSSSPQGGLQPGAQDHIRVCDQAAVQRCPGRSLCQHPGENMSDLPETCSGTGSEEGMFCPDQEGLFLSQ